MKKCKMNKRGDYMFDTNYMFDENNFSGVVILLDKNSNIIRFNEKFGRLQGYQESDLYMTPFVDIIVPEDKSLFLESSFNMEQSYDFTIQCYHKQGAFRYFSFNMVNFKEYSILFGKMIKKQFNNYEYIDETLNYLQNAINNLDAEDISDIIIRDDKNMSMILDLFPIDIWVKDRFNRYVFVNNVFKIHTGHSIDDVYLRDDFQLFSKEIAKEFTSSDKEAIEKGTKINYTFYSSINKLYNWTEVTKIPLYNTKKEYIGLLGFSADITESKSVEEKLKSVVNKYSFALNKTNVLVMELNLEYKVIFSGGKLITKLGLNNKKISQTHIDELFQYKNVKNLIDLSLNGRVNTIYTEINNQSIKIEFHPNYEKNEVVSIIAIFEPSEVKT